MKRVLLFVLITLTFITFLSYSQTRKQRVRIARAQIEILLSKYKNGSYKEVGEVIDVDSSLGKKGVAEGKISDPYGTLKGCYLFMTTTKGEQWGRDRKHLIGIFKDSLIIWMSEQLPGSQDYGVTPIADEGFLATKDLNRRGKVDIVVYFSDGTNPPSAYFLWIFSWDGKIGKCINKCDKNGETIIASTGAFDVLDVDGDGIDELRSCSRDFKINAVYYWNDSLYVEQPKDHR